MRKEKEELQTRIGELERLLADRKALIALLKKEMQQLIKQFGDERRTTIDAEGRVHAPIEAVERLHEREPLVVALTRSGTLKTLPPDSYTPKGKNGNAVYTPVRGDEQLKQIITTTSQDYVLCVTSLGRVFQIAAHRIPAGTRPAKGEPVRKLLDLSAGEEIVTILPIESHDDDRYLVVFSKLGKIKKSALSEYKTADVDGLQDIKLADGDAVVAALLTNGAGEFFVTTNSAQTLRFSDEAVRPQGRVGQGMAAMALGQNTPVVGVSYLEADAQADASSLLVITQSGLTKKVPLSQYAAKGRATAGIVTTDLASGDKVLLATIIHETDHLLFISTSDGPEQATALKASALTTLPRVKKGVPLMKGHILGVVKL